MSLQRVLLIQTAFIGDLILTTPLLQALREGLPHAHLTVLARAGAAEVMQGNPHLDALLVYDKRGRERGIRALLGLMHRLRQAHFDLAVVPHPSLRSALLAYAAAIPQRVGFANSAGAFLFTRQVPYRKPIHQVERNLELAAAVGSGSTIRSQARGVRWSPAVFPGPADRQAVSNLLQQWQIGPHDRLIGLSPASVWPTKRWLAERFVVLGAELNRQYGVRMILFGGPADRSLCATIAAQINRTAVANTPIPAACSAAGKTTLLQSASLAARCRLVVGNDTGMIHLAAAMGVATLVLFGPTVPDFGFTPYGPGHHILQQDLPCRPCSTHGGSACPLGTLACMKEITTERVLARVVHIMQQQGTSQWSLSSSV